MCMRHKKIQSISNKIPHCNLDTDALLLIRSQIEKGDFENFLDYDLEPSDIDILNHLSPLTKLKAKTIFFTQEAMCGSNCECPAEESYVNIQGSDVYFHCEVCEATVLELNMKLKKLALELRHKYLDLDIKGRPEIRVWIRSDGEISTRV